MYKLAKFRKQLKDKTVINELNEFKDDIRKFGGCFYVVMKSKKEFAITMKCIRVNWDRYYQLKELSRKLDIPGDFSLYAKEWLKYGQ